MSKKHRLTGRDKTKGFLAGFKNFVTKGNVIDMAVGVVIGGAFGKIVTSLVNDIILPPIGVLLGGVDFKDLRILIRSKPILDDAGQQVITNNIAQFNRVYINYGNFIQNILEFLIIAFSIYFVLFFLIRRKEHQEKLLQEKISRMEAEKAVPVEEVAEEVQIPIDIQLLSEIRDLLKNNQK